MITRLKLSTIEQGLPKYRSMLAGNDAFIPSSFESIASATGTGSSNTITFSSIPGTYQHLQIRGLFRSTYGTNGGDLIYLMRFNSDTGSNYTRHYLEGNGSAASAYGEGSTSSLYGGGGAAGSGTTNTCGASIVDIHNYASTSQYKTVRVFGGGEINTTPSMLRLSSGVWMSTSAITSITLLDVYGNFTTQSQFALYGIKGA